MKLKSQQTGVSPEAAAPPPLSFGAVDSVITVNAASKRYGRKPVLDSVSLEVPSGVVFALLGENGAGKSTLIRGLLGYFRFDSGSVRVLDLDPVRDPLRLRRMVGYVSDSPGMYEWMTVAQVGWFAAGYYADGFIARFEQLVRDFELPVKSKVRQLSKGMRAQLALSLALSHDPDLLILDEPTSGLDPAVRRSFLENMVDRAAMGRTVFLSSHQIHEVERVADWVAILHQGKLQIAAPLEDLKCNLSMLCFSQRDPLLMLPNCLGQLEIYSGSQQGRTQQWLVRGLQPSIMEQLSQEPNIFDLKHHRPNLEELYLAFTQSKRCAQPGDNPLYVPQAV